MADKKKRVVGVVSGKGLKKALKSKKGFALICVIAVACLLYFSYSGSGSKTAAQTPQPQSFDADAYVSALESRLESVISSISGAGKTKVMLTLDGSAEYYYQSDVRESGDADGEDKHSHSAEFSTVIVKNSDGGESPVISAAGSPAVTGVVVVCRGAGSTEVRESIYNAVKALLGIPANRICVLKMS